MRLVLSAGPPLFVAHGDETTRWKLEKGLASDPALAGSTVALASLGLNDAVLTHALWFSVSPDAPAMAPPLAEIKDVTVQPPVA